LTGLKSNHLVDCILILGEFSKLFDWICNTSAVYSEPQLTKLFTRQSRTVQLIDFIKIIHSHSKITFQSCKKF